MDKKQRLIEFFDKAALTWNDMRRSERLLERLEEVPIKKGDKVLDIGCGTGVISNWLYERSQRQVHAIDISPKMIDIAQNTHHVNDIKFECLDFYEMQDGCYDLLICFDAYPHFLDAEAFAKKSYELLNKGGHLVILHDIGRKELDKHHEKIGVLSRLLKEPEEEAKYFDKYFQIIKNEEDDDHYLIILRK